MTQGRSLGPEQWGNSGNGKNGQQPKERGQWDLAND